MKYACCWGLTCTTSWWPSSPPPSVRMQALSAAPRMNREHKERCEMDWSDKVEAYNIDETCARYNNQSTEVQFHPHSTKFEERWAPTASPRDPAHKHTIPALLHSQPLPSQPPFHSSCWGCWSLCPGSSTAPLASEGLTTDGSPSALCSWLWAAIRTPVQVSSPIQFTRVAGAARGGRTQGWGIPASRVQRHQTRTTDLQLHTRPVGALGPRPS